MPRLASPILAAAALAAMTAAVSAQVRAGAGTPISRTGTLLPAAPARPAFAPGPAPSVVIAPPSDGFLSPGAAVGDAACDGAFIDGRRGFFDSSGLTVRGAFTDDHFRLRFRVGGATGLLRRDNICRPVVVNPGFVYWGLNNWYWSRGGEPVGWYGGAVDPALTGYTPRPAPAPEPQEPLSNRELGDAALRANRADWAAVAYREHLKENPGDAEVKRLLGVALIARRAMNEGVALVALAYREDPTLAERPLADDLLGDRLRLRSLIDRASGHARRVNTASSWLAMAALVQAQGKPDVAAKLVERARAQGLDATVADRLIRELSANQ